MSFTQKVCLALLCCLFISIVESNKVKIRGLSPADLSTLNTDGTTFRCRDGSKTIPFSQVNDDFCDCESDGSDEPGTNACPNGKFYCRNIGSVGKTVFSSRVGDGICDCCDGSDEKLNPNSKCKNTCHADAREANKGRQQELDITLKGLSTKKEYIAKAERELREKRASISQIEEEVSKLRHKREEETATRDRLQKEEEEARAALQPAETVTPPPPTPVEEQPASDEQLEEFAEEGEYEEEESAEAEYKPSPSPPTHHAEDERLQPYVEATRKQREVVGDLDRQISEKERSLEDIKKAISQTYGHQNAFYGLLGNCYHADTPEYTYELCPFDKVNQNSKRGGGSTNLGTWSDSDQTDEWKSHQRQMRYTNGLRCWGGPDRSAIVNVLCGSDNVLSNPQEPNKCEYHLNFHTPAACSEEHAQFLRMELSGGSHEEEEDPEAVPVAKGWGLF